MKYDFVKAVVNSLNDSHKDYVTDICNNNLPKAIDNTILEMVKDGRYKKFFGDFETLRKAIIHLDERVKRKTELNKKLHYQDKLIQAIFDTGLFGCLGYDEVMESLMEKGVIDELYYCECNSCGNCFEVVEVGSPCDNCNEGTMQPQDVEPY